MADGSIDTGRTYVATGSRLMRWALAAAAVFVVAAGGFVVGTAPDPTARIVGGAMALVGLVATVLAVRWARRPLLPVVTLGPDGIRDVRVATETVPWRAVQGARVWKQKSSTCVILTLDPAVEAGLTLTRAASWGKGVNKLIGAGGYVINTTDCSMSDTEMMALVEAFRARWAAPVPVA